jgi:cobalt-zinc-cadmium efflux system outer membrane protein
MRLRLFSAALLAMLGSITVRPAHAQLTASLADDLVLLTNRLRGREAARTHQHLGPGPGSMESPFMAIPGAPQPVPSEPTSSLTPGQANILPPPTRAPAEPPMPLYGMLEVPAIADEGPPDGVSLDQAIDRLVQENPDLQTRFRELPKAQADIVSASLRNNPFLFGDVSGVPYGSYTPQRQGNVIYEVTLIQPWDVNQKRRRRITVAKSARSVVEFLYQDAVRLQIDNLYTAFIDVLAAREAQRQLQVGLEGWELITQATSKSVQPGGTIPQPDLDRVINQRDEARLAVQEAQTALRRTKNSLALLLNLPPNMLDYFDVRGAIGGFDLELPPLDKLVDMAMEVRPDLNAYRLGVERAKAEVKLALADRWNDVFILYTPWSLQDNRPIGGQNSTSWSLSALVTLPMFNRNQGNIRRAQITVAQTVIELEGREKQVISEVQRANEDFVTTRNVVQTYQDSILPRARRIHEAKLKSLKAGTLNIIQYYEAQKEYNEMVRRYLDAAVRFRRSSLRLNTAVGQRIVP